MTTPSIAPSMPPFRGARVALSRTSAGSTASRLSERLLRSPALVLAIATVLAFPILEMLLHGERATQFARDVFDGDLPGLVALRDDWLQHGVSLWDTHLTGGNAALAQFALPPTTPDFLLSFAIPLFGAYAVTYAALIWLAGYGMVRFLRGPLALGPAAALFGGILYAFSFWHFIHGFVLPLLPLLLWLTDRWADASAGRTRYSIALVLLATFGLYAGLLQLQILVATVQGAYLLATRPEARRGIHLMSRYLAIWTVALLLFAPVLLTQLVALGASHRAVWDLSYLYDSAPVAALRRTISLFGSAVVGVPVEGLTTGTAEYSGTFFLGGLGLVLALLGVIHGRRDARARFVVSLLLVIPVVYLVALLVTPIQGAIPVIGSFQAVRISHLFPFASIATAAMGADLVLSGRWRGLPFGRGWVIVVATLLLVLVAEAGYAAAKAMSLRSVPWLVASVAILAGVAAAIAVLMIARRSPRTLASTVLVLALLTSVVGERMLFVRAERDLGTGLGTYAEQMRIDPAMAFIAGRPNPGLHRTLAVGTTSNRMLVAGFDETGGYQSIYPRTYHALFGGLTDPYLQTDPDRYRYFHGWGNRAAVFGPGLDRELLDLMGVRWVYADRMDVGAPGLTPVFQSGPLTVYENASVFPRAFVVNRLRAFGSPAALLDGLMTADRDDLLSTGFVLDEDWPGPIPDARGDARDAATVVSYAPDRVEIQATSGSGGYLVLTDTAAPGWRASVDGVDAPILPVDLAYRAVAVPSGSSTVIFTYRPWFTYAGLALSAGAVALLVLWGLLGTTFVSRRRGGGHSSEGRTGSAR